MKTIFFLSLSWLMIKNDQKLTIYRLCLVTKAAKFRYCVRNNVICNEFAFLIFGGQYKLKSCLSSACFSQENGIQVRF